MADKFIQTNINLTEEDDSHVDQMMKQDGFDNRSAFIRKVVRQEWARRVSQPNQEISISEVIQPQGA
jgi:Arc/MetJ-type ribon-helix-helix transcriptional regulator